MLFWVTIYIHVYGLGYVKYVSIGVLYSPVSITMRREANRKSLPFRKLCQLCSFAVKCSTSKDNYFVIFNIAKITLGTLIE